jgi:uncharacterized protein (DUF362 family)
MISRRDFIKGSIGIAFALNKIDIVVVEGEASRATETAIEMLGGIKRFVKKGHKVIIKPNMSFPNPYSMATTTNPKVVAKVARLCSLAGANPILIIDNPIREPELCLNRTGIRDACRGIKNTYIFSIKDRSLFKRVKVPKGKVLGEVEVVKDIIDSDIIINIPVAKSHSASGVSFGMKNLMGLIWDRKYFHERVDLNQAIADLNTLVKPRLTIIDATRILLDGGPGGPGRIEVKNKIIAGTDPVALDSYTTEIGRWYGREVKGRNVKHILYAYRMGLGEIDINKLNIVKKNL